MYATLTTDNGNLTSQTISAPGFSQTQYQAKLGRADRVPPPRGAVRDSAVHPSPQNQSQAFGIFLL